MATRTEIRPGAHAPVNSIASRCGIEQEFYVFREDARIDFREVIHTLAIPGARLDPGDRNAYRLTDGSSITADGREAEFASIPIDTIPGFAPGLAALTARHYETLRGLLPADMTLRGAATHINVSVPSLIADRLVLEYVQSFGPMLQALWDRPSGQGIMIRPRPGRVEFGGEFIAGARLAAVALFCVASVSRLARGATGLPRFQSRPAPASERLGVELQRSTYADDFYQRGRAAELLSASGKRVPLARALPLTWKHCRVGAERFAERDELRRLDRIVRGRLPLGIEGRPLPPLVESHRIQSSWYPTPLAGWSRPDGTVIRPRYDTWNFTVMHCERGAAGWLQVVPRTLMSQFAAAACDPDFSWPTPVRPRTLHAPSQLYRPGVFSSIAEFAVMLPLERAPGSRWYASGSASTSSDLDSAGTTANSPATVTARERPGKWRTPPPVSLAASVPAQPQPRTVTRSGIPRLPLLIALMLIAVIGVGVVTVVALGGGEDHPAAPAPGTQEPPPTSSSGVGATSSPTAATGAVPPTSTPTSQAAPPSPTGQPTSLATGQPTALPAAQPTVTPLPTSTVTATVEPTATPGFIFITTQVQFTQIITSVTGACGGSPPTVGMNLSPASPTAVVLDWSNHTIKVGDSQVSSFNPGTYATTILYGTGDQRQTVATISPNGLSGTSSFYPYWNVPAGATCFVTLATNAVLIAGQPPLFP